MIKGEIIYTKDIGEFSSQIVNILIRTICECFNDKGKCFIALSGGSTLIPVFELLSNNYYQNVLDWSSAHIYFIDERCVPKDHPDNNFKSCYDIWLKYCPKINIHRIEGWLDPMVAARKYEKEINLNLDDCNGIPQFDLIIMGISDKAKIPSLIFSSTASYVIEHVMIPVLVVPMYNK